MVKILHFKQLVWFASQEKRIGTTFVEYLLSSDPEIWALPYVISFNNTMK